MCNPLLRRHIVLQCDANPCRRMHGDKRWRVRGESSTPAAAILVFLQCFHRELRVGSSRLARSAAAQKSPAFDVFSLRGNSVLPESRQPLRCRPWPVPASASGLLLPPAGLPVSQTCWSATSTLESRRRNLYNREMAACPCPQT